MRVVHPRASRRRPPLPPKRELPTVATLAHVIPRKRHGDVLEAVALLAGRAPDLQWVAIGDGPEVRSCASAPVRSGSRSGWSGPASSTQPPPWPSWPAAT